MTGNLPPVVNFSTVLPAHAEQYNYLRLNALLNHPAAFGSSYDDEARRSIDDVRERLSHMQKPDNFVLGAFVQENLCGFVAMRRPSHQKLQHKAYLSGMYVVPEYQRHGIGQDLLREVIQRAKQIDELEVLLITVASGNEAAYKLYASLGFQQYAVEPRSIKLGDEYLDEWMMRLAL